MNRFLFLILGLLLVPGLRAAQTIHQFERVQLDGFYWSEGANFGDLNNDSKPDAISGPYWWEGPGFKKRHEIYAPKTTFGTTDEQGKTVIHPGFEGALGKKNAYSGDNFFTFAYDFTRDGWRDVLTYGLPGTPAYLYVNNRGGSGHWQRFNVLDQVDNESPTLVDITGDGVPEIISNNGGQFGYAGPDPKNPTAKWKFTPITRNGKWSRFTHGLGVGDVNGDGRADMVFKHGWFEQPASLLGNPEWKLHAQIFSPVGGAQMYVYDVNGDGLNDVITSLAAHGYGLAWFEQVRKGDSRSFKSHVFMNKTAQDNRYGVQFSQLHAVELVDIDGDGLKDIVTGKTFWAHGPSKDPDPNAPAVLYWFQLRRDGSQVDWVPHRIDDDSGIGRQIGVADIDGDGRPEIINGNKKGTFVFRHRVSSVSREEWTKSQPKVLSAKFYDRELGASQLVSHTGKLRSAGEFTPPKTLVAKGGVLPKGDDGKPLNLDFEAGSLNDWKATGDAWAGQPFKGNIDQKRKYGAGRYSLHQGDFWIGGYEVKADTPKGTLTSASFKITHPYAAFRIGGGKAKSTRVELIRSDTDKVFFTVSGRNSEVMFPEVVDLRAHMGKHMIIRVVDEFSGGWGHVNFDDFRFFAQRPKFPGGVAARRQPNPTDAALAPDEVAHSGLSPEKAVAAMTMPKGFSAGVFAAEPDVKQPIAMCLDDRGRVWIAEAYGYPFRQPEGQGKDRILCFEDSDGDGSFDRRTVFMEKLNLVSGLEYGFGGLWVGAAPYLYFIPITDGDAPKPAGKPQVMLEGFAWQDTHETLNSFRWGPDGWLYGCHGVFTHSHVKRPQDPDSKRQYINAGIFRFHPTKHAFEVFAEGTSNPWGIDFNEYGHAFIEACVIPHFWHIFQGGKYQRQAGQHYASSPEEIARVAPEYWKQDFSVRAPKPALHPYVFEDIKTHGDHLHYLGSRAHAGNNRSDAVGGGHAHAGLMIYQGDSWPEAFRGKVFMGNIHGQRINMDSLARSGSGFIGKHAPDFLEFNDMWSQALNFRTDQNGSVLLIDWYDQNQCHRREEEVHDRSNGRIYKVIHGNEKWTAINMGARKDMELVLSLAHPNVFQYRHALRRMQEDAAEGKFSAEARDYLKSEVGLRNVPEPKNRLLKFQTEAGKLRILWALHVTAGITDEEGLKLLRYPGEHFRAWVIQLLLEKRNPSQKVLDALAGMARTDKSPMVRLYIASALQRIPVNQRSPILEGLLAREEDAKDHNLPLMYWYAAEPVVGANRMSAIKLLTKTKIPAIRQLITRRMTAGR
jgi:putative membrane-bound dehydrogenase-like protein